MQQIISTRKIHLPGISSYSGHPPVITGLISKFMAWCNGQEKNWFTWIAIAFVGGIATVLPLTLLAIVFGGDNSFTLWLIACIVNVPILVVNLAEQPTTIKLPVLFFAWATNAVIMLYCLVHFFVK